MLPGLKETQRGRFGGAPAQAQRASAEVSKEDPEEALEEDLEEGPEEATATEPPRRPRRPESAEERSRR